MTGVERQMVFFRELVGQTETLPGVVSVGLMSHLPLVGDVWSTAVSRADRPPPVAAERLRAAARVISPGYLRTAGVAVFFGLLSAGWYPIVFLYLVATGVFMMVFDIFVGRVSRQWATGLLMAGILYAAGNIGVFIVTMSHDDFAIFELAYIIPAGFGGPGLMIIAAIIVAFVCKRLYWLSVLGFAIWIGCVGFAHVWVIAQCSASV